MCVELEICVPFDLNKTKKVSKVVAAAASCEEGSSSRRVLLCDEERRGRDREIRMSDLRVMPFFDLL